MKALEENKHQSELKIKFAGRKAITFNSPMIFFDQDISAGSMSLPVRGKKSRFNPLEKSGKDVMDDIFALWTLFSRHVLKHVEKPARAHEIVSRIIRAFISRVEIKGKEIKPILKFDEALLEQPLNDLMRAFLNF